MAIFKKVKIQFQYILSPLHSFPTPNFTNFTEAITKVHLCPQFAEKAKLCYSIMWIV